MRNSHYGLPIANLCGTLSFALSLVMATTAAAQTKPAEYVNPMVGTDAHGHTFPGATVPFGLVQLSPDTHTDDWDGCSGYHFRDSVIQGFSHTHLAGTGCGGLGDVLLMPEVGSMQFELGTPGNGYASRFSHAKEVAKAGYYKVFLDTPGVTAEMTATEHVGFHRYTFPATNQAHILVDLVHGIQNDVTDTQLHWVSPTKLTGYRKSNGWGGGRAVYFVIEFSKPYEGYSMVDGSGAVVDHKDLVRGKLKVGFDFKTSQGESIDVKVAISPTGIEGAEKNMAAELPGWDFNATHQAATEKWNAVLAPVELQSKDTHFLRTFYTNLYDSYLAPALYNDADGAYWGMDHKIHRGEGFDNYTTFSLWDTYRALHPMMTLLQPKRVPDMVQSLLSEYAQSGLHTTPIWPLWGNETYCMIGYHSVPVIVDAYFKGFKGFDPEKAYQAMRDTATRNRDELNELTTRGYVVSARGRAATSKTLEYAYDDWCLGRMAKALGHDADSTMFYKRAGNYRSLFDSSTGFMRGRKADGTWRVPFDTHGMVGDEYTEADPWQYAFCVQQDIPGLIKLFGGDKQFLQKLDQLFVEDSTIHTGIPDISGLIGQYSQGDEQCHHVAYLYDYAGQPWKTQSRVREVMTKFYNDTPAGQCGNVDCGQMSAWYIFSSLGFYPVNPASQVYLIGSPKADKAVLHLDADKYQGHTFTIVAKNNSEATPYIQSISLNGHKLNRLWITHQEIIGGGTLELVMGAQPNTKLGVAPKDRPGSMMPADIHYAEVPKPSALQPAPPRVTLSVPIRVVLGSDDPVGAFIPDPNLEEGQTNAGDMAIDTSAPGAAPESVYKSERYASDLTYKYTVPVGQSYTVKLHFAEIFDDGQGMRMEDVSLNGSPVLKDFDIFKAAGGKNRAVVKEFKDVRPNAKGEIVIRVSASHDSPDQNAKLCAIEILK